MGDRDFKGVWIPKEIWLDERLNALEKVILVEIDSLDRGSPDYCWKSNENLAEFCQCSVTKVSNAVSKLIELGYVKVAAFDGRTRRLHSCIAFSARQPYKKCKADLQNLQASNTYSNTKDKNIQNIHSSYSYSGNLASHSDTDVTECDTEKENRVRDRERDREKSKRFIPPSVAEIREYITEMDYPVDPERFFDYYESNGWMAGKNKMKDWKAAVRLWVRNRRESAVKSPAPQPQKKAPPAVPYQNPDNWWNGMTRDEYRMAAVAEHDELGLLTGYRFPDGKFAPILK